MKKLYLIGGTMGVGKTAVSTELNKRLPACVMLDGDWCWAMDPFVVNDETKGMVMDNICHLLNGFLNCSAFENIVFCWVMHEQSIIDEILSRLDTALCQVIPVSLTCSEDVLRRRLMGDIQLGKRKMDVIDRSIARLPLYRSLNTHKIDTTEHCVDEVARQIALL